MQNPQNNNSKEGQQHVSTPGSTFQISEVQKTELLNQQKLSDQSRSQGKQDSSSKLQVNQSENKELLNQKSRYDSFQQSNNLQSQKQSNNQLNTKLNEAEQACNFNTFEIQDEQSKQQDNHNASNQDVKIILLQCQQEFCYIIEQMINFELETPKKNGTQPFNINIQGYIRLRNKLSDKKVLDLMKQQEAELLEFFQGWFLFDETIEKIKSSSLDNSQAYSTIKYSQKYDFETECLKNFQKYIYLKKQKELDTLKKLYKEDNTMNNLKKIKDNLNINNIQLFVMLREIQDKEQNNKYAQNFLLWWFDWNETQVFTKPKENLL